MRLFIESSYADYVAACARKERAKTLTLGLLTVVSLLLLGGIFYLNVSGDLLKAQECVHRQVTASRVFCVCVSHATRPPHRLSRNSMTLQCLPLFVLTETL